jgi:hypothetical protein
MPTWDSDEAIKIVPRGRTVFGDGHVAISLLRGGKHGVIFADNVYARCARFPS